MKDREPQKGVRIKITEKSALNPPWGISKEDWERRMPDLLRESLNNQPENTIISVNIPPWLANLPGVRSLLGKVIVDEHGGQISENDESLSL